MAHNERERHEHLPPGIILCTGKNTEKAELLELGTTGTQIPVNQ